LGLKKKQGEVVTYLMLRILRESLELSEGHRNWRLFKCVADKSELVSTTCQSAFRWKCND